MKQTTISPAERLITHVKTLCITEICIDINDDELTIISTQANTQIILLALIPSLKLRHLASSCDDVSKALARLQKSSHTAYLTRSTAIVSFPKPKQTANPL